MSAPADGGFVLTVSGLAREARIAAGPSVKSVAAAGPRLAGLIEAAIGDGAAGILSFGIAGGLDPGLRPGAVILAGGIITSDKRWPVDAPWRARLATRLRDALPGDLAGVDAPVLSPAAKAALAASGARAVDMESHIAARLAGASGLPFAALRVVCDPADRVIPPAAIAGMREDGSTDLGAILQALLGAPGQLPAMIRLACEARAAFGALDRCRHSLGVGLQPL